MGTLKDLVISIIGGLVVYLITSPQYMNFFNTSIIFPNWIYVGLIIVIFSSILIFRKINKKEKSIIGVGETIYGGYEEIGQAEYYGLKWIIRIPNRKYNLNLSYDNINIKKNPICPLCNTELKVKEQLLWNTWYCIDKNCGFKLRSRIKPKIMRENVEKLCKRDLKNNKKI